MKKKEAEKLAKEAIENATPQGYDVAGSTVVYLEKNGKYAVADNGEEIRNLDRNNAIRIIVENLTN